MIFLLMYAIWGYGRTRFSLTRLKRHLAKVDPYRLIKYHFPGPNSTLVLLVFQLLEQKYHKVNVLIFICRNERSGKNVFLFWTIQKLIQDLIDHFRYGNGNSFHSRN